eukprot:gene9325-9137_t
MSPESELYATVVTSSLGNTFYEGSDARVERISKLIQKTNPEFVAKLAVYARTQMNMRSVPLVLAVELAKTTSGNGLVSKAVKGVVKRADEITELLAYYQMANMRSGAKKLNKLSKQDESQQALFDKIAKDTLETPYTWETEMSGVGQKDFDGKKAK